MQMEMAYHLSHALREHCNVREQLEDKVGCFRPLIRSFWFLAALVAVQSSR